MAQKGLPLVDSYRLLIIRTSNATFSIMHRAFSCCLVVAVVSSNKTFTSYAATLQIHRVKGMMGQGRGNAFGRKNYPILVVLLLAFLKFCSPALFCPYLSRHPYF